MNICDVGDVIDGRYRLERSVGSGGMGMVYLAMDLQTGKKEAVKVLHASACASSEVRARLEREIELLSRLHSPHIAELRATGYLTDGSPYFVMEYLEGRDLKAELRRRGPLPYAEAAAYLVQACRGVAVAHHLEIVHRDLKPHNLFVTGLAGARTVKVVDFGIAKALDATDPGLTATNTSVGTPLYMSPEQLLDAQAVSTKADVWALGVILYELLAGFSPFTDDSPGAVIAAVTLDEPFPIQKLRADVPSGVTRAIDAALVKLPSERLESVEAFMQLLQPYATPDDRLVVTAAEEAQPISRISRPTRARVSAYLMERILVSMDAAAQQERVTIRCAPTSSTEDSVPIPERLSLVPDLKGLAPALPGMIRSVAVADTKPVIHGHLPRVRRHLVSLVLLASLTALGLVAGHMLRPPPRHTPKSTALDVPVQVPPLRRMSSATAQTTESSVATTNTALTQLTNAIASPAIAPNATKADRRQPVVFGAPPNATRTIATKGAATAATGPAVTAPTSSTRMVPKHL